MSDATIRHRQVPVGDLSMHIAEAGAGPLVLLCHGFPECWYSWRHQLTALAAAGYHAVAPDMRGYGRTGAPEAVDAYTIMHLVGDMTGLVAMLGEKQFSPRHRLPQIDDSCSVPRAAWVAFWSWNVPGPKDD